MGQSVNDTLKLVQYIEEKNEPNTFYLNRFAAAIIESDEEDVLIEMKFAGKKMAPLVMPMEQGQALYEQATSSRKIRPAYVKMKDPVTPQNALRRRVGEDPKRLMGPAQRLQAATMNQLLEHDKRLDRRLEWMAARGFQNGQIVLTYKNKAPITVSFGRDPSLTKVLDGSAGNEFWSDVDIKIVDQIETHCALMAEAPGGVAPTDIILPLDVWQVFKNNKQVLDLLDKDKAGQEGDLKRGVVMPQGVERRGVLQGGLVIWVDTRTVELADGSKEALQPAKEVLFISDAVEAAQHFGAILDVEALIAVRSYPKYWNEKDPGIRVAMTQSAPIVAPGNPNATSKVVVLA